MFKQIELPYAFDALEPFIDTSTMETHYLKHHAAYTKNLNDAVEKAKLDGKTINDLLAGWKNLPAEVKTAIRNNGGGHYNHNLYFAHLAAKGEREPTGLLAAKIDATFTSFGEFKNLITKAALGQFGFGWAWLAVNKEGDLRIMTSPNQDNPILETEGVWEPIFAIDVWEHAYYLKHKNLRGDYIKDLFEVVDWSQVAKNYDRRHQ